MTPNHPRQMGREIKFRAWVYRWPDERQPPSMVRVFAMEVGCDQPAVHLGDNEYAIIGKECHLMQYTGLKDRNGKEIFEGDVVYIAGYGLMEVEFPFIELYEASFEGDIGDVKGNIYENPDLLKGPTHER